ncbi:MAG: hypothetical protein KDC32_23240, partial [Saprospiraceae bacterium]|nr:hypothetical protein [Saprospiraceae bacterium]
AKRAANRRRRERRVMRIMTVILLDQEEEGPEIAWAISPGLPVWSQTKDSQEYELVVRHS